MCTLAFVLIALATPRSDPPKEAAAHLKRAVDEFTKGEFDRAIREFDEVIRLDPKNPLGHSGRGTTWFRKKEYAKAVRDLDVGIRLAADRATWEFASRGSARYMAHDYDGAVKDFDKAIELNPMDLNALNGRAWAAAVCPEAKHRDSKLALDYAKRACAADKDKDPFYLGTLAAAHAANGQFADAVKWQKMAMDDPAYTKEYGDVGRTMLKLFEQNKPYLEERPAKK